MQNLTASLNALFVRTGQVENKGPVSILKKGGNKISKTVEFNLWGTLITKRNIKKMTENTKLFRDEVVVLVNKYKDGIITAQTVIDSIVALNATPLVIYENEFRKYIVPIMKSDPVLHIAFAIHEGNTSSHSHTQQQIIELVRKAKKELAPDKFESEVEPLIKNDSSLYILLIVNGVISSNDGMSEDISMAQSWLSDGTLPKDREPGSFPKLLLSSPQPIVRDSVEKYQHISGTDSFSNLSVAEDLIKLFEKDESLFRKLDPSDREQYLSMINKYLVAEKMQLHKGSDGFNDQWFSEVIKVKREKIKNLSDRFTLMRKVYDLYKNKGYSKAYNNVDKFNLAKYLFHNFFMPSWYGNSQELRIKKWMYSAVLDGLRSGSLCGYIKEADDYRKQFVKKLPPEHEGLLYQPKSQVKKSIAFDSFPVSMNVGGLKQ